MRWKDELRVYAQKRSSSCPPGYEQPEHYPQRGSEKYEFQECISPINRACKAGIRKDIKLVAFLKDWSSEFRLNRPYDPRIQELGYDEKLRTNTRFKRLLASVKLTYDDIYISNVFPWVKAGNISASLSWDKGKKLAHELILAQIRIIRPPFVLALAGR